MEAGMKPMTDRYERIRAALAMGPTPGPWQFCPTNVERLRERLGEKVMKEQTVEEGEQQ